MALGGRRPAGLAALAAILAGAAGLGDAIRSDVAARRIALAAESLLIETGRRPVEVAVWGEGPPVVALHGAGGGHDQGRLIAEAYAGRGFRWISPSRFGYLSSPLPEDASPAAQAEALAAALDALGIARVGVLAMSGGVAPALAFAERYPERTAALILLSAAPFEPLGAAARRPPAPLWVYRALFASEAPYWVLARVARPTFERVFGVEPAQRALASPGERAFIDAMIDGFPPVAQRAPGLANEGAAVGPAGTIRLGAIAARALVVHARDDGLAPFATALRLAEGLPTVDILFLETGCHLLLGSHAAVRARVRAHLEAHPGR